MLSRRAGVSLCVAFACWGAVGAARAQTSGAAPVSKTTGYSRYEKETIVRALAGFGLELDPAPEGKTIEGVDVVRLDVLEDRDPVPEKVLGLSARKILNSMHYESRDFVIRREMLLREGDKYVQVLVDETARNMRRLALQVSLVVIVATKGSAPDRVRLLAITKDIWSLRLSYDVAVTPGGIENLSILPQETNVLGWHHTASTQFRLAPETITLGAGYRVPRFGTSWLGATASTSIIFNRRRGEPEGTSASIGVERPLYSTRTEWAWGADVGYSIGVARRYVNARVATFDSQRTPDVREQIPFEYKSRSYSGSVALTRSFGWALKNNFSVSLNASTAEYNTFAFAPGTSQDAIDDFTARAIPIGESRVYPRLSWSSFTTNFLRTFDLNTLGLQEDFRLGHSLSASFYPVSRSLGSSRDFIGVSASAGYVVAIGDGVAGVTLGAVQELQDGALSDASYSGGFGAATPRTPIGRLVMNASFLSRYRNYLRSRSFLGGDDRLRGYPSNFFFGKDYVVYNIEYRSRPLELLGFQIGGVLFFDSGDAAQGFDLLRAKQSVGVGARLLFPQLNRLVTRLDLAFPLKRGPFPETGIPTPVDPVGFFFSLGQAFSP
ncbi:MAG: hypothetical protein KC657_24620 [Myxococcales bacterium]|nr:hypothetical protein [Myxococcales bacterium]